MKRIEVGIELSDKECQELVSWIAEKIIQYQERRVQVIINSKVIIDQVSADKEKESYKESIVSRHTGYTVESEGLEKDNGENESTANKSQKE